MYQIDHIRGDTGLLVILLRIMEKEQTAIEVTGVPERRVLEPGRWEVSDVMRWLRTEEGMTPDETADAITGLVQGFPDHFQIAFSEDGTRAQLVVTQRVALDSPSGNSR